MRSLIGSTEIGCIRIQCFTPRDVFFGIGGNSMSDIMWLKVTIKYRVAVHRSSSPCPTNAHEWLFIVRQFKQRPPDLLINQGILELQ
jgi:hypothetical protein